MNCETSVGEIRTRPCSSSPMLKSSVTSALSAISVGAMRQSLEFSLTCMFVRVLVG